MSTYCVAGIDLGYGSSKAAIFDAASGRSREIVLPAGAAPAALMPKIDAVTCDLKGGEEVLVNGALWCAGVEQRHIQHGTRQTHANYVTTDEYLALYLACLARLGQSRIDILVTGLPVSQFFGSDLGSVLQTKLAGRKHVNGRTMVEVSKVICIAQPLGTYMGMASMPAYAGLATQDEIQVLCVDVGFGTVDWVAMNGRAVKDKSSSSSLLATSVILEGTAKRLSRELGFEVSPDHLDSALRNKRTSIPMGLSGSFDFAESLAAEAAPVAKQVVADILRTTRTLGTIHHVILTGGGGHLYEAALRDAFPGTDRVIVPDDPVLANALGYRSLARQLAERASRKVA